METGGGGQGMVSIDFPRPGVTTPAFSEFLSRGKYFWANIILANDSLESASPHKRPLASHITTRLTSRADTTVPSLARIGPYIETLRPPPSDMSAQQQTSGGSLFTCISCAVAF